MSRQLKWLGHSAWQLTTAQGKGLLFDPGLQGNPLAPVSSRNFHVPILSCFHTTTPIMREM